MVQQQFLEVLDPGEAERRWHSVIDLTPLSAEMVAIDEALGRVMAEDIRAAVDVPSFDRSNMDGFALRAEDTYGAMEEKPVRLRLNDEVLPTGVVPAIEVRAQTATTIATGAMLPRGVDAVLPVEYTDIEDDGATVIVRRPVVPGENLSFAGTDIGTGEVVLFAGTRLTSRDTGVLAAIGAAEVCVVRRPRVAIISTGDEVAQPGEPMRPGLVYDSNGRILADAVRELGGDAWLLGGYPDDEALIGEGVERALAGADVVLLSGGTSKGEGDVNSRVVGALTPGIVVHGVALKPGKPICLAAQGTKPVIVLPGFPTSAVFTFHEFVAPVIRRLAGQNIGRRESVRARLAMKTNSERGRLEYLLVGLVRRSDDSLAAYPMGKGSGSVTAFSRADGFIRIERNTELLDEDMDVEVVLIGRQQAVADLVVIGSHCVGLDLIASELSREGFTVKLLAVGSQGGLAAARRGECDLAPIHLLDPATGEYNTPFLDSSLRLLPGYRRLQGIVTRMEETRGIEDLLADPAVRMVSRNRGSGTRVLIEQLLGERRPPGYAYEPRSHFAVAAAVAQSRADWGVTIETVARESALRFRPLQPEHYDFAIPADRWERPAVRALRRLLDDSAFRARLQEMGFAPPDTDA